MIPKVPSVGAHRALEFLAGVMMHPAALVAISPFVVQLAYASSDERFSNLPMQARYVGHQSVEACEEPSAGSCEQLHDVRIMTRGFAERSGVSYSRAFLPDGRDLWIKTVDVISMDTDYSLSRKRRAAAEVADCKKRGGAKLGMSAAMVLRSCWGKPQKINETLTARGRHEQWVYPGYNYLYLENGVLTSIQTSRQSP